jgi:hypothetical protein
VQRREPFAQCCCRTGTTQFQVFERQKRLLSRNPPTQRPRDTQRFSLLQLFQTLGFRGEHIQRIRAIELDEKRPLAGFNPVSLIDAAAAHSTG